MPALLDAGYRVVTWDMRSHGASHPATGPFTITDDADRPFLLRLWPERHLRRVLPSFMSRRANVRDYVAQATEPVSKATLIAVTRAALGGLLTAAEPRASTVPVLLVHGGREQRFVVHMIRAWAARDPQVDIEPTPDAGHLVNQDDPVAFNDALLRFLRRRAPIASNLAECPHSLRMTMLVRPDATVRHVRPQTAGC